MTDREAYIKLSCERPIIVAVMNRDMDTHRDAVSLANHVIARDDPEQLQALIRQCSRYMYRRANNASTRQGVGSARGSNDPVTPCG